jgi:hypothetical protein
MVGEVTVSAMKGRVEAGHLNHFRSVAQERPDRGQVEGLVQRCKICVTFQARQNILIDPYRPFELRSAVDDAVADGKGLDPKLVSQPRAGDRECLGHIRNCVDIVFAIDKHVAFAVHSPHLGTAADPIYLPLDLSLQTLLRVRSKYLELDAR